MRGRDWLFLVGATAGCAPIDDARERELVSVMVRADEGMLRARPLLMASKYRHMASSPYAFFRGTLAVYFHDQSHGRFGASEYFAEAYPMSSGDPHPENFGTLVSADGTMALEPNDFDAADRYPYLWEVRRLAVGMCLAARSSNYDDNAARAVARGVERDLAFAAAAAYAAEIERLATGADRSRLTDPTGAPLLEDLFERALEDAPTRAELAELTVVDDGKRRLLRGPIDPDDPENVYTDAASVAVQALPQVLADYRLTLAAPPGREFFALKDAIREYGSGVASRPRVRMVLLVEGATAAVEDDVLIELKELGDSGATPVGRPTVSADTVSDRVLHARGTVWSRPDADPLWGTASLLGLPVQLKGEFESHKTIRVVRMIGDLGTPAVLTSLADRLGVVLARMHAGSEGDSPGTIAAIAARVGEPGFPAEQADYGVRYADLVEQDFVRFGHALEELGPTLGVEPAAEDAPDADVAALLGEPPAVR